MDGNPLGSGAHLALNTIAGQSSESSASEFFATTFRDFVTPTSAIGFVTTRPTLSIANARHLYFDNFTVYPYIIQLRDVNNQLHQYFIDAQQQLALTFPVYITSVTYIHLTFDDLFLPATAGYFSARGTAQTAPGQEPEYAGGSVVQVNGINIAPYTGAIFLTTSQLPMSVAPSFRALGLPKQNVVQAVTAAGAGLIVINYNGAAGQSGSGSGSTQSASANYVTNRGLISQVIVVNNTASSATLTIYADMAGDIQSAVTVAANSTLSLQVDAAKVTLNATAAGQQLICLQAANKSQIGF